MSDGKKRALINFLIFALGMGFAFVLAQLYIDAKLAEYMKLSRLMIYGLSGAAIITALNMFTRK